MRPDVPQVGSFNRYEDAQDQARFRAAITGLRYRVTFERANRWWQIVETTRALKGRAVPRFRETPADLDSIERGRQIAVAMMDRAEAIWRHDHGQPHKREECVRCAPEFQCPRCERWAIWTNGQSTAFGNEVDEFWCQTCGAESPLSACAKREQEELNP